MKLNLQAAPLSKQAKSIMVAKYLSNHIKHSPHTHTLNKILYLTFTLTPLLVVVVVVVVLSASNLDTLQRDSMIGRVRMAELNLASPVDAHKSGERGFYQSWHSLTKDLYQKRSATANQIKFKSTKLKRAEIN